MTPQWSWTLAVLGVLTIAGESKALACSCAMSGPPCQAAWTSDAVFSGTVLSMTPIKDGSLGAPFLSLVVKFTVEQGFVNVAPGSLEIVTGMGGGDCGYRFKVGVKYLVYATKYASHLSTSICSRTRPLAEAKEDLLYLSTMGAAPMGGRVYGRINESRRDPAEPEWIDYGPVEGLTVSIRGATFARDVVTDADGRFDASRLPVGKATVTIVAPFGFEPNPFEREIEITGPRACSLVDLTVRPIARASGVVLDGSGRPLVGVMVDAVAAELAGFDPPPHQNPVKTNERGAFEFRELPPGKYVFGINLTKDPLNRRRGSSVYLPGTAVASEATVIELMAGDRKELGTLRLAGR
jgi:hypothetical protein